MNYSCVQDFGIVGNFPAVPDFPISSPISVPISRFLSPISNLNLYCRAFLGDAWGDDLQIIQLKKVRRALGLQGRGLGRH
jgi:hypothetical protein